MSPIFQQRCPSCGSKRTRKGYRPNSIFAKLVFRYYLLCDDCNREYRGFAFPRPGKYSRRKQKAGKNVSRAE